MCPRTGVSSHLVRVWYRKYIAWQDRREMLRAVNELRAARGKVKYEACHEKTDLKVFVVVIPKEGWARVAAPILLLV